MKALFIGGPLDGKVKPIGNIRETYTHQHRDVRGTRDVPYTARDLRQTSTGDRWLIFVHGPTPPPDEVFAMIQVARLPTVKEQRNG